ncbi:hypothetical protein [Nocardia sp. NPDC058480]|uniref:hypothetical protein n=1 Tax=unclassified Nocardia TaxID=2637762 RepID=UPI0036548A7D
MRGAVERRYRLRRERARIDGAAVTPTDQRQIFVAAMATLLAEFDAYITDDRADPVDDLVGFRQHSLWLDPDELAQLITGLRAAIAPQFDNAATPGRSENLLSPILFPLNRGPEATA